MSMIRNFAILILTFMLTMILRLRWTNRENIEAYGTVGCERDVKLGEHDDFELVMLASFPGFGFEILVSFFNRLV